MTSASYLILSPSVFAVTNGLIGEVARYKVSSRTGSNELTGLVMFGEIRNHYVCQASACNCTLSKSLRQSFGNSLLCSKESGRRGLVGPFIGDAEMVECGYCIGCTVQWLHRKKQCKNTVMQTADNDEVRIQIRQFSLPPTRHLLVNFFSPFACH